MVTYEALFAYTMVIIGMIGLILQIVKKESASLSPEADFLIQ